MAAPITKLRHPPPESPLHSAPQPRSATPVRTVSGMSARSDHSGHGPLRTLRHMAEQPASRTYSSRSILGQEHPPSGIASRDNTWPGLQWGTSTSGSPVPSRGAPNYSPEMRRGSPAPAARGAGRAAVQHVVRDGGERRGGAHQSPDTSPVPGDGGGRPAPRGGGVRHLLDSSPLVGGGKRRGGGSAGRSNDSSPWRMKEGERDGGGQRFLIPLSPEMSGAERGAAAILGVPARCLCISVSPTHTRSLSFALSLSRKVSSGDGIPRDHTGQPPNIPMRAGVSLSLSLPPSLPPSLPLPLPLSLSFSLSLALSLSRSRVAGASCLR